MIFPTGIDGLDLLLDGGIRFPDEGSFFAAIIGGPGTGKTNLALELTVRALDHMVDGNHLVMSYALDQSAPELRDKIEHDFNFYGIPSDRWSFTGGIDHDHYAALVQTVQGEDQPAHPTENVLYLGSVQDAFGKNGFSADDLIKLIDRDIGMFGKRLPALGSSLTPTLVTVDNIGISSFENSHEMRESLRAVRHQLEARSIHGIFVIEAAEEDTAMAITRAAEYAADLIIHVGYHRFGDDFKERSIEISKARYQFYYRGTHHFSIVGQSGNGLRGARGQRPPGIHIYPSVPTLLSWIHYHTTPVAPPEEKLSLGFGDLEVSEHSSNGLLGTPQTLVEHLLLGIRFLTADEEQSSLLISLKESPHELESLVQRHPDLVDLDAFRKQVVTLHFQPEYISSGKFLKDIHDYIEDKRAHGGSISRVLITNLKHLDWAFPLLKDAEILVPWMVQYFKRRGITSLFLNHPPELSPSATLPKSRITGTVDNLLSSRVDATDLFLRVEHGLSIDGDAIDEIRIPRARRRH